MFSDCLFSVMKSNGVTVSVQVEVDKKNWNEMKNGEKRLIKIADNRKAHDWNFFFVKENW